MRCDRGATPGTHSARRSSPEVFLHAYVVLHQWLQGALPRGNARLDTGVSPFTAHALDHNGQ